MKTNILQHCTEISNKHQGQFQMATTFYDSLAPNDIFIVLPKQSFHCIL